MPLSNSCIEGDPPAAEITESMCGPGLTTCAGPTGCPTTGVGAGVGAGGGGAGCAAGTAGAGCAVPAVPSTPGAAGGTITVMGRRRTTRFFVGTAGCVGSCCDQAVAANAKKASTIAARLSLGSRGTRIEAGFMGRVIIGC